MKFRPIAANALILGLSLVACSSGGGGSSNGAAGTSGTAGKSGSAGGAAGAAGGQGTGGGNGAGTCSNVNPCGGSPVGNWSVSAACLSLSGSLDLATAGLDPRTCTSAPISGTLNVTGSFSANANGTYTDGTTTTGNVQIALAAGCLMISGTVINCDNASAALENAGYTPATCTAAASGGCNCMVTVNQKGGLGIIAASPAKSGNYSSSANVLSLTTDSADAKYAYCASANGLTVTPQSATPTMITGSVALQQSGGGAGGGGAGGAGGTSSVGGSGGTGGVVGMGGATGDNSKGPCDIYGAASPATPCVAAYSTIRRLSSTYSGPLYQVRSMSSAMNTGSGGMTKDIGQTADGYADTAMQDSFCNGTICTFSLLYDQSGNGNDLPVAKKGKTAGGAYSAMDDFESNATKGTLMVGGHKVYSLYMNSREGYRSKDKGKNMPLGTAPQGIYELADGTHSNTACCWDFGNVIPDAANPGFPTMNTLFFGKGFWGQGAGQYPWFMADFEAGVWSGGSKKGDPGWGAIETNYTYVPNMNDPSMMGVTFALGMLKTQPSKYAIRAANVATATDLTTAYEGALPKPMDNQGGIVIGVGGDNSNNSAGTFYEGAIVAGYPTNEVDLAVMTNLKTAGYGK
jgi:hypothetical protein